MTQFRNFAYLTVVIALFNSGFGFSQAYNFQQLSLQEGLPQSQAYAIEIDTTQHVWIGTQGGGLCRYDGFNFDYFTKNDVLLSNRVYSVNQIDDKIWVGQKGGITVFNIDTSIDRSYFSNDPTLVVQDVSEYHSEVYCATNNGIYYIHNDSIKPYTKNVSLNQINLAHFFKDNDELWLCSNEGMLNFNDPLKKLTAAKGLSAQRINTAIRFGRYWAIGTYGGGLDIYDPSTETLKPNPFKELNNQIILSLFVNRNELWVGTLNSGIYVYDDLGNLKKRYQNSNGLSNDHVRDIISDRWGNIWIGTSGGGVCIFQNSPFIEYNRSSGLNGNYIYSVLRSSNGDLWAGTDGLGVVRLTDSSSVIFDEEYGFFTEKTKTIFEDTNGDIWLGTEGKGLGIFSPYDAKDTVYTYSTTNGLKSDWIKCFAENPNSGEIYIGTLGAGIISVQKDWQFPININFETPKIKTGHFPNRITSLKFIGNQIWYTSSNEYGYYENDKVVSYNSSNRELRNCVGNGNYRWLGSTDNGVLQIKFKDDSIISENWIDELSGLQSNNIYQLLLDDFELWVGTEKGLDRIQFDSTYNISEITHFGYEEGFEGVEANINAVDKDDNGGLWFGTVNGLFKYQGGEVNYQQRQPPTLMLTDLSIFYESIEKTKYADYFENGRMIKSLVLPYDMNHIGFSFKAVHHTYSKNIRYRWKLVGADPEWTPPSKITTATYSNLDPGPYTFKVKTAIDDNWDDVDSINIKFSIDKPYYEKLWFKVSYYSLIGFVLLLIAFLLFIRIKRKNKRLKEKYELEKNLVELEQKALRLQMNPHFIFNVLTSIHNLIILNDPDKARYALSKFSKLMRRVLENSREKLISIDDEIETLENYVQLEKLTSDIDIELKISVDPEVDGAEEILPPLMIQPFVENAIIHGFKGVDHPGRITVSFELINPHLLECSVQDNGRGRKEARKDTAQKSNYHKSTALEVTQERLANLNPEADFTPFEIIDLKDKKGNACGTKVIFRLAI